MAILRAEGEAWADVEQRDANYLADLRIAALAGRGLHRADIACAQARAEGFVQGEVKTLSLIPHPWDVVRASIGTTLTEHCAEL